MTETAQPTVAAGTPTITERLADHVVGLRYDDIPAAVVDKAKHQLAYLLGSAFRGHGREGGRQAVGLARELSGDGGDCTIIGVPHTANLLDAVFANASLIAATGLDDYLLPHGLHPGVVAAPAALAFGERYGASGREVLAALVAGYDVMGRLCDPALTWGLDVYTPATFVVEPFGAAATGARLLGLGRDQTVHALGHAAQVGRHIVESGEQARVVHQLLARNGAMAAMLAKGGLAAGPAVLEGDHGLYRTCFSRDVPPFVEAELVTLGDEFTIAATHVRPDTASPLSAHNLVPVTLTQQLVARHGLDPAQLTAIDVTLPDSRQTREEQREAALARPEADRSARGASLRLRIAMVIAHGDMEPARFERPPDDDLLAMLEKVRLRFEPDLPFLYARVEATTTDGRHYTAEGDVLESPRLDAAAWVAAGARGLLSEDRTARLVDLIGRLDEVSDVSQLTASLVPDR